MLSSLKSNGTSTFTDLWASLRPFGSSGSGDQSSKSAHQSNADLDASIDGFKLDQTSSSTPQSRSLFAKSLKGRSTRQSGRTKEEKSSQSTKVRPDFRLEVGESFRDLGYGESFSKGSESVSASSDKLENSRDLSLTSGHGLKSRDLLKDQDSTATRGASSSGRIVRTSNVRKTAEELGRKPGDHLGRFGTDDYGRKPISTSSRTGQSLREMSKVHEGHERESSSSSSQRPHSRHHKETHDMNQLEQQSHTRYELAEGRRFDRDLSQYSMHQSARRLEELEEHVEEAPSMEGTSGRLSISRHAAPSAVSSTSRFRQTERPSTKPTVSRLRLNDTVDDRHNSDRAESYRSTGSSARKQMEHRVGSASYAEPKIAARSRLETDSFLTVKTTDGSSRHSASDAHNHKPRPSTAREPSDKHNHRSMMKNHSQMKSSELKSSSDFFGSMSPVKVPDISKPSRLHLSKDLSSYSNSFEKPAASLSAAVEAVRQSSNVKHDPSYTRPSIDIKAPTTPARGYSKRGSTGPMSSFEIGQEMADRSLSSSKFYLTPSFNTHGSASGVSESRKGSASSAFSIDTEGPMPSFRKGRESIDSFQEFLVPSHHASISSLTGRRRSSTIRDSTADDAPGPPIAAIKLILDARPRLKMSDFELKATVGTGTFGRVRMCKLKNCEDQTPLALKILKKSEVIRLKQVEHVKSEKDILKRIHHPFIVNLFATFQDSKRLFMVMEFVHGGELFSYLRKEGRLDNAGGRFYASEITVALQYLHTLDIVYRDLKPENLLIDGEGHVKITDFGFAKVVKDRTWTVCGTPEYLAPEVIQSKGHGKSVDWWALGILIFEMLAGFPPFYDENPFGIYQKVLAGKINFPRYIDIRAKDLIKRLLSHDRTKRFGCLKGGAEDIKRHKWFKSLDWDLCVKRQVPPPFVPETKSPDDTSMFDQYPESTEGSAPIVSAAEQELFADF